jgi:uncharacterized protein YaiI (UPF0178 family)
LKKGNTARENLNKTDNNIFMRIFVDADSMPNFIKEILFRAADRTGIPIILVANQILNIPQSDNISSIVVPSGPDEADDRIVELVRHGDLVITADIPLADRVVSKGGCALDPRGALYSEDNIKEKLAIRNLMSELRDEGSAYGGPGILRQKDRSAFANQLDRYINLHFKKSGQAE